MRQSFEYAKMAFRNITGNKMRSLLTMLGIIIGIGAVIVVLCIGNGGQQSIQQELAGIANGSVYLMLSGDEITDADFITDGDIEAISRINGISDVTMLSGASGTARGTREDVRASIDSGNASLNKVMPSTLLSGRFWNENDYNMRSRVCTVDSEGAKELFGSDNVVGMKVRLTVYGRSADFTIVGITKTQGMNFGRNITANFTVPQSSLAALTDVASGPYYQIAILAENEMQSAALGRQAAAMLEMRHGNAGRDMYAILDVGMYMAEINTVITLFTTIIAVIAGISLLVGGIGVMNIMLVSVTERTREIGIRKALGAKTGTIMFQFLVESAILTLVGGVIGIALGVWGGAALGGLMGISASVGWDMIVAIVLFSSAIGIFFGIYPARKAARLNPIEALRSE